jgi:UDP-glucose 4-epimerase
MKKVLVVGGSGFMGSHLADELTRTGHDVHIFDATPSPWLGAKQHFIQGNILDREQLKKIMPGFDIVYHFAGIADIGEAALDPRRTLEINVMGTTNLLEACVAHGVKRFMFASTVYVYSDKGSFYRVSKQAAEAVLESFSDKYGLDYTILRYGSLYGERSQSWNGLKKYVAQALKEGKIIYRGTGHERREYIHVLDAARLSVEALDEKFVGESLTFTGYEVYESMQLMKLIAEIVGKKVEVVMEPLPEKNDHYEMTPYRYSAKPGVKIVPSHFIDLGQGILRLVEEIDREK